MLGPKAQGSSFRSVAMAALVAIAVFSAASHAADMNAREITTTLFDAEPGTVDLSGRDLSNLDLSSLDFKKARLVEANLFGADLSGSNLSGSNLTGARLDRATLMRARFIGADLTSATILRPNIFASLEATGTEPPDFSNARMLGAKLAGRLDRASFAGADLSNAVFAAEPRENETLITPRTELAGCDFSGAKLQNADLGYNNLQFARLVKADARGASFANSNLEGADFSGADVTGADFTNAQIAGARFGGATGLDTAKGLPPIAFNEH
ncbi:MAG TPA: pentapeptide repeat-containing protein [Hyphomicrobium sp.]|nr:pentapeptide repeat-containing protein [Hyphomicrobium sp.]